MTAEELLYVSDPGHRYELVNGRLVVREPPGYRQGWVMTAVAAPLATFVRQHGLGVVLTGDAGFVLRRRPDTVRAPDVSFISRARLPDPETVSYAELAPDLAVEILSPSNTIANNEERFGDLLAAGTRLLWILDPDTEGAEVRGPQGRRTPIAPGGQLDGEDVVPGFRGALAQIFRAPTR